jgi:hypothetical protein
MSNTRVAEEWEHFRKMLIGADVPLRLVQDMEMAFYAGVSFLYRLLTDLSHGDEAADLRMLREVRDEIDAFNRRVRSSHET